MFKVGIVTKSGRIEAKTFSTRDEVDDYLLQIDDLTHYHIYEDNVLIETEHGRKVI